MALRSVEEVRKEIGDALIGNPSSQCDRIDAILQRFADEVAAVQMVDNSAAIGKAVEAAVEEKVREVRGDIAAVLAPTAGKWLAVWSGKYSYYESFMDAVRSLEKEHRDSILAIPSLQPAKPALKRAEVSDDFTWPQLIERITTEHNGVFSVHLFFGHDGHRSCEFHNYEKGTKAIIAGSESGRSMQEAVDRCVAEWRKPALDPRAVKAAKRWIQPEYTDRLGNEAVEKLAAIIQEEMGEGNERT